MTTTWTTKYRTDGDSIWGKNGQEYKVCGRGTTHIPARKITGRTAEGKPILDTRIRTFPREQVETMRAPIA